MNLRFIETKLQVLHVSVIFIEISSTKSTVTALQGLTLIVMHCLLCDKYSERGGKNTFAPLNFNSLSSR